MMVSCTLLNNASACADDMMHSQFRDDLRKTYDRQANQRNASSIQEWKGEERESFLSLLQKEDKHTLLEIGSGPGRDGEFFQK